MIKRNKSFWVGLAMAVGAGIGSVPAAAVDFSVRVVNLTRGIYFTPLLVVAHNNETRLFTSGTAASASLRAMAEGGDIAGLVTELEAIGATVSADPASGLLAPGASTSTDLNTDNAVDNTRLSVVAMMLPTNDGFIGLNGVAIPTEPGTYIYNVNAYDAGTEANDELVGSGTPGEAGFPAPGPVGEASGTGGTGVAATVETYVHIHRNVLGDDNATGGVSDIDNVVHRWLNPAARVIVTVE